MREESESRRWGAVGAWRECGLRMAGGRLTDGEEVVEVSFTGAEAAVHENDVGLRGRAREGQLQCSKP